MQASCQRWFIKKKRTNKKDIYCKKMRKHLHNHYYFLRIFNVFYAKIPFRLMRSRLRNDASLECTGIYKKQLARSISCHQYHALAIYTF